MSGHSKFANIKHKKERTDAKKGKVFTKLGREIAVAVKEGGSDPSVNGKLRDVIAKCKSNNMPNDTITRSIKKAAGEDSCLLYTSCGFPSARSLIRLSRRFSYPSAPGYERWNVYCDALALAPKQKERRSSRDDWRSFCRPPEGGL